MPSGWETLSLRSTAHVELIDITERVAEALPADADGVLFLVTPHTTAALLINEHEEGLLADIRAWLDRFVPRQGSYAHNRVDDNADAHLRAIVLGSSLIVPVEEGKVVLGRWQRIFFVELDGPRDRQVRFRFLR